MTKKISLWFIYCEASISKLPIEITRRNFRGCAVTLAVFLYAIAERADVSLFEDTVFDASYYAGYREEMPLRHVKHMQHTGRIRPGYAAELTEKFTKELLGMWCRQNLQHMNVNCFTPLPLRFNQELKEKELARKSCRKHWLANGLEVRIDDRELHNFHVIVKMFRSLPSAKQHFKSILTS